MQQFLGTTEKGERRNKDKEQGETRSRQTRARSKKVVILCLVVPRYHFPPRVAGGERNLWLFLAHINTVTVWATNLNNCSGTTRKRINMIIEDPPVRMMSKIVY